MAQGPDTHVHKEQNRKKNDKKSQGGEFAANPGCIVLKPRGWGMSLQPATTLRTHTLSDKRRGGTGQCVATGEENKVVVIGSCDLGRGVLQSQVRLAREKRTENRAETGESPRTNGERNEVSSFSASRAVREGRGCFRLAGRSGGAREERELPRGARPVCREKLSYTERYAGYACCATRKLVRLTPGQADPVQLLTVDLAGCPVLRERHKHGP